MTPEWPDILFDEAYEEQWEAVDGLPKANSQASPEVKDTLDAWRKRVLEIKDGLYDSQIDEIEEQ